MSLVAAARARLRLLFARSADSRMDKEFCFHIDMETDRLVREAGLDPAEARRQALVAFGGVEKHKEALRDERGFAWATGLPLDVKLGVRMLIKYPGLTIVGTLALAVAMATGAAYLELLTDIYHPTLPIEHAERVVRVTGWNAAMARPVSIENLAAKRSLERNLITSDGRSEPIQGEEVTASAFRVFGMAPLLGRFLMDDDEQPGAAPVVVLAHALWQSRFGGDSSIVGRAVRLGRVSYTVVGVMPAAFPSTNGLWVPLRLSAGGDLTIFGRLAPGVSLVRAQAEVTTIESPRNSQPRVTPFLEARDGDALMEQRLLYAVNLFFVAFLGVCCANVATLVFARTATREGEISVRSALGASRGRIVTQLFAEALVLTVFAAVVGLVAAAFGLRWVVGTVVTAVGAQAPLWWKSGLSAGTLAYAGVLTVIAALIVGVVPALKATGPRLDARLKHAAAGGAGMRFGGMWTGVIVTQVALTVAFLLIVVSIGWNAHVGRFLPADLAINGDEYLSVRLELDREGRTEAESPAQFEVKYRELERRLQAEPGVAGVTYASRLPGMDHPHVRVDVEGESGSREAGDPWSVRAASVDPGFFETLGTPVFMGRGFDRGDIAPNRAVVIVDQAFVRRVLGDRDPLGIRIRVSATSGASAGPWLEIVGVARNMTKAHDASPEPGVLYSPAAPGGIHPLRMAVHARGDAGRMVTRLRAVAAGVDPALRLHDVVRLSDDGGQGQLFGVFVRVLAVIGAVALLLSTAGVYALMSFTVARRRREIGIRAALGADAGRVIQATFSRGLAQVGLGVVAGSIPGGALVMFGAPEGVQGAGPVVGAFMFLSVAAFVLGVGVLACVVPARRALGVHPREALNAM